MITKEQPKIIQFSRHLNLTAETALNLAAAEGENLALDGKDVEIIVNKIYDTSAWTYQRVIIFQVPDSVAAYDADVFEPYMIGMIGSNITDEVDHNINSLRFTVRNGYNVWLYSGATASAQIIVREA